MGDGDARAIQQALRKRLRSRAQHRYTPRTYLCEIAGYPLLLIDASLTSS
jgi:hypothetical protein